MIDRYFKMKHLAAYLLLTLGGNTAPTAGDIEKVLGAVGIDSDSERVAVLLKELEGKSVDEVCLALDISHRFPFSPADF